MTTEHGAIAKSQSREKFMKMMEWLITHSIKMEDEIFLLLASQLMGRVIFYIGKPGCGKSFIAKLGAKFYGERDDRWFYQSIQANTTSDEVFGGAIAEQLLKGVTEYNLSVGAASFPIVIMDEIFKLENPDLYHKLLSFFDEESTVKSGGRSHRTKLEFSVLTSNELPDLVAHEALLNRINIKRYVKDLEGEDRKLAVKAHGKRTSLLKIPFIMKLEDLYAARSEACQVTVPDYIWDLLMYDLEYEKLRLDAIASGNTVPELKNSNCLVDKLASKGIRVSQRVLNQLCSQNEDGSPSFLQAIAWLQGDSEVNESHLYWLTDCLWTVPEERPTIESVIKSLDNSSDAKERLDGIKELLESAGEPDIVNWSRAELTRWNASVTAFLPSIEEALEFVQGTKDAPKRLSPRVKQIVEEIKSLEKGLTTKIALCKKRAANKTAETVSR